MKTLICDCNRTMPLDAPALQPGAGEDAAAPALTAWTTVHTLLCRREAGAFQRAAKASGARARRCSWPARRSSGCSSS